MPEPRRRETRWREATQSLASMGFRLETCRPDELAPHLPFLAMRSPERCVARVVGHVDGSPVQLIEYEWTRSEPESERVRVESLVVIVDNPGVTVTLALEPDDGTRWRYAGSGERVWLGPPDRRTGIEDLDRAFRVYAESDAAAHGAIPSVAARHLVEKRFSGVLELRPGRLVVGFPHGRLSPSFAKQSLRHVRALLRAFPVERGGPFRSGPRRHPQDPG